MSTSAFNRDRGVVIGSCIQSTIEYSHDFVHCKNCLISMKNIIACSIKQCPCDGEGLLFETENATGKTKIHVHQIPCQDKSVRVCLQRTKQAIERITKLSQKFEVSIISSASTSKQSKSALPNARQKRRRNEEYSDAPMSAKNEQYQNKWNEKEIEITMKKQKKSMIDNTMVNTEDNLPLAVGIAQDTLANDNNFYLSIVKMDMGEGINDDIGGNNNDFVDNDGIDLLDLNQMDNNYIDRLFDAQKCNGLLTSIP